MGTNQWKSFMVWMLGTHFVRSANEKEKILFSIRVTAKCRFSASERLMNLSKFNFLTMTFLSLGLIFIPLMQNSSLTIYYKTDVLNLLQIFFAVSILIFSIITSTASYRVRATKLNECGDKLKNLARSISSIESPTQKELEKYNENYTSIVAISENHLDIDYINAKLDIREYKITGIQWIILQLVRFFYIIKTYIIQTIMIIFEIVVISDMLGITKYFTVFLSNNECT